MIGQDAVTTAQAFLDGVGYDGVVLTKLDGDARGGAALSIASITGKPVMFASNGEKMTDFDLFHPDRMASRILDMGDMLTLIEQAEKTFDQEQAAQGRREAQRPGRRVHPRRLPRADAAGPQARLDAEDHGDAARDGPVPRAARELRRARDRPHPGDHPVDDAGRAGQPQDHRRLPPGAHRQGFGPPGLRRQQPRRPLLRGPQDDDAVRHAAACPACPGCRACRVRRQARPAQGRRTSRARAAGSPATRPRPRQQEKAETREGGLGRTPTRSGSPDGEEIDYEKAAAALDLPKDFSKYLK